MIFIMEKLREEFLKIYSNLSQPLRKEIIVVIEGEPYTWSSAYFEVKNKTKLSEKILNTLRDIGII